MVRLPTALSVLLVSTLSCTTARGQDPHALPGTRPLKLEGDIASHLVAGVDRFLLRELERSPAGRQAYWELDSSSSEKWERSLQPNRERLARILGVRSARVPFEAPELVGVWDPDKPQRALVASGPAYRVYRVRWPVVRDVFAEGLLLIPKGPVTASVVALPDADQVPEQLAGLRSGASPFAAWLAASGCRVLVPTLISRRMEKHIGRATLSDREFLHRAAFMQGRTVPGYETQMALAACDWFEQLEGPVGVIGYGEGGMVALFAAALDPRIDAVCVSGFFGPREGMWQEPLDRNVFRLLRRFGGAELLSMVAPRVAVIEAAPGPAVELSGEGGGAPAVLAPVAAADVKREFARAVGLVESLEGAADRLTLLGDATAAGSDDALRLFLQALGGTASESSEAVERHVSDEDQSAWIAARRTRLMDSLDRHNQWLLRESHFVRKESMKKLDTSSLEAYRETVEPYRAEFRDNVIGRFDRQLLPPAPRTRQKYNQAGWTGYEVALDVFPDVIAYGVLLVPRGIQSGERRPVVVCQHGLEGRPTDVIEGDHRAYHDFAAKLCERGFVVFAPQNLYIFRDRFRTLQRKANPVGCTLFSVIVPQHQQIVNWLKSLPWVDSRRIAFYGLSYGGKSAMRIPPLVPDYCLSICSADFNEWVLKNASTRHRFSYVGTGEYEIFEFDLGSTFNYAEMAALIAPRPFMVERGHFDGVGTDEWVAFEFAKVRNLYAARLHIADRCEIEWFDGPHTINGKGTFEFLHKHLNWPKPAGPTRAGNL